MGVCVGDLDPRQQERLRTELVEVLAAYVAYPPFFHARAGQEVMRPLDRAKRDEIEEYVRSISFAPVERVDVTSPEIRRFLERVMLRYIEVNPVLARPRVARRVPQLRARVPRMAAEVQRGLIALVSGEGAAFGSRRQPRSWAATLTRHGGERSQGGERNTRVLAAILMRSEADPPTAQPLAARQQPPRERHPEAARPLPASATPARPAWSPLPTDATVPVPAQGWSPSTPGSPFAGLEVGAQSAVFGAFSAPGSISERPTGPLPVTPPSQPAAHATGNGSMNAGAATPRELPSELYRLYSDYLRDMEPELDDAPAGPPEAPTAALPVPPPPPVAPPAAARTSAPPAPAAVPAPGDLRSDKLIFWQLRYQLEAYVRRAARSYGVRPASDDPFSILDALRRSGFVDEADLRIAEGILALADRVTAGSAASLEDYRQALMLYLLYHRSHLG